MTTLSQLPSTKAFKYRGEVPSGSASHLLGSLHSKNHDANRAKVM